MAKHRQTLSLLKTYAKLPELRNMRTYLRIIAEGSEVRLYKDSSIDVPFTIETYIPSSIAFSRLLNMTHLKKYIDLKALYNPEFYQKEIENPTLAYRRKLAYDIIAYGSLRYTSFMSVVMGFFSLLGIVSIGTSIVKHIENGKFRGFYVVILLCSIIIAFGILPTLIRFFNSDKARAKYLRAGILTVKKTPQDLLFESFQFKLPSKIEAKLKNFKQAIESRKISKILNATDNIIDDVYKSKEIRASYHKAIDQIRRSALGGKL